MARPRDSRSPSPAGSRAARRRNDKRRERDRRDGARDNRRRSRSPGDRRYRDRDRDNRDRDRDRDRERERDRDRDRGERDRDRDWGGSGRGQDSYRRRDRSLERPREDDHSRSAASNATAAPAAARRDGVPGGNRDRRSSRDRAADRTRSPDSHRPRSRDENRDSRAKRDDSRDRGKGRREGTAESGSRRDDDVRSQRGVKAAADGKDGKDGKSAASSKENEPAKSTQTQAQSEAEKKAERLRKIKAMKEKHAMKEAKENDATAGSTRRLFAEMDQKASGIFTPTVDSAKESPAVESPATPSSIASPLPYAGKFDPKAIAKSSKAHRALSPARRNGDAKLGVEVKLGLPAGKALPLSNGTKQSLLPTNRAVSGFGFSKTAVKPSTDADKMSAKRKIDLDDEEISNRKLVKLPDASLENADDTPYNDQEDQDDGADDDMDFARDEEEAAASARAAHERREERILQQSMAMQVDGEEPASDTAAPPELPEATAESMDVDDAEEVDPLDAFMADLEQTGAGGGAQSFKKTNGTPHAEPEAYFSEDDYGGEAENNDPAAILAMTAKRKKKDIPAVDYSKLQLDPIRKNFWVEPYELSQLTEEETVELRLELDGIKVSGKDVPKPVQKWSQCGLTRPILDTIDKLGYEKPTPIQMQALPVIMSGRDVIGVAKTGSGKTMAFLLPMFRHIKDQNPVGDNDGPVGLIMTPTRELAVQIHRDCKPFLKALDLRAVAAYGGAPIKDQIAELKRGAEIVVATPGRMIDLLAANQGRVTNLKRVTYIVLDEADRMFDMGFEPQVMKIFNNVRPDRQTILFSATMPRIIDALTKKVLREPVEITVGGRSVVAPEITQVVEIRDEKDKFNRLLELLGELYVNDDDVRALIFVERQEKADILLRELLRRGYGCMSLHGGKDQVDRDSTISDFKAGICPILVATSVAARGLDVKQLKLVVNFDAPNHLEDYVHRAGRTGRAGNTGTAVTFITEEQENCAPGIAKALEQSGQPVPERLNEMRKAFRDKVKTGKAKDTTGFGGKGLEKLDKDREAARLRERKTHKGEGEEEVFNSKEEAPKKEDEKTHKAQTAIQSAASAIISRDAVKAEAEAKTKAAVSAAISAAADAAKTVSASTSSASVLAGGVVSSGVKAGAGAGGPLAGAALDKASSVIHEINARLAKAGQLRPGQPIDNKGPDAGAFHATLEINDFPQKARWAVTNRTNVAKILEATGTSITTKGNYYAAGKEPPPGGEPKLYILIEGDTEVVVGNALSELTRLLREGTIAAADAESRQPASGRYTVT